METALEKRIGIDPIVVDSRTSITHIRLRITHDIGGYSWMTGQCRQRGVCVDITPIKVDPKYNSYSVLYDGKLEHQGFSILCIPTERKSPKKMRTVADKVFPHSDEIVKLFLDGKYNDVFLKIKELIK